MFRVTLVEVCAVTISLRKAGSSCRERYKNAPLKNLPYPFPGFGPRDSNEQEQIPFPPSPAVPDESAEGHGDDEEEEEEEVEVDGDIVVEVEEEEEEGDFNPRSSEKPSSFSGRASNSLLSLGQPVPSRHPFGFRHPARGGSMLSTGSPPSHSRVQLRHHRAKALQPVNHTKRAALVMWSRQLLLHHLLLVPPSRLSLPHRLHQVHRMYVACPCTHAIQPLVRVAANALRQRQFRRHLRQQAVLLLQGHDKRSRDTVGNCIRALARNLYRSLTVRMIVRPARRFNLRLMARSRCASAKTLLAYFLHHLLNRVLGHPYLAHATAAQPLSRGLAALSAHALDRGMKAHVQAQAVVGAHGTIPMSQYLARLLRSAVHAHTVLSRAWMAHRGLASSSFLGVYHSQVLPPLLARAPGRHI